MNAYRVLPCGVVMNGGMHETFYYEILMKCVAAIIHYM